jgi:hypothetical protein
MTCTTTKATTMPRPFDPRFAEAERAHIAAERAAGKPDLQITSEMLGGWALAMAEQLHYHREITLEGLIADAQHLMGTLAELGWTHPEMTLAGSE